MIFEIFAFFGIVIALLAAAAELGQKPFLGIAASVLLLVLSFWVLLDSVQFPYATQTIVTGSEGRTGTNLQSSTSNSTTNSTSEAISNTTTASSNTTENTALSLALNENVALNRNETTTTLYANIPEITPAIETKYFLWLVLLFCSLYGLLSYAEDIRSVARK